MAVIRVLLVDDNAIVRRGIASLLDEADGIARRSGERLAGADEGGIHARVVVMHFEAPS
jgi:DNA-binding NarL/FixJ family response regulator